MNDQGTRNKEQTKNRREFDLEERTTEYAKAVIKLCRKLQKGPINNRIIDQLIGSSGSIGANYREANDSLGKRDFLHKIKISRKESKESIHWLLLAKEANENFSPEIEILLRECTELRNILSAIIKKIEI